MGDFRKAHAILLKQAFQKERRDYPFKVAQMYEKFFFQFGDRLAAKEKDEIVISAKRLLDRVEKARDDDEDTRNMRKCVTALEKIA